MHMVVNRAVRDRRSMNTLKLAEFGPVIPVIVIQRIEDAVPLARALVDGGVRVLEVTLRTPVALASIEAIAKAVPEAIVGAGTVRSIADAHAAKDAGCRFAVSPGYASELALACRDIDLPLLPGVATASEVMRAAADGYRFLKLFPATAAGGIPMLKSLAGPFPTSCSAPPAASRRRPRASSSRCRTSRCAAARG